MPKKPSKFTSIFVVAALLGGSFGMAQLVATASEELAGGNEEAPSVEETNLPKAGVATTSTLTFTSAANPEYIPVVFGGTTTFTVTFSNPSQDDAVIVNSFDASLPPALSYVTGSSKINSIVTTDPTVTPPVNPSDPTTFTWAQGITVPAGAGGNPGTGTLEFNISKAAGGSSGTFNVNLVGVDNEFKILGPQTGQVRVTPSPVAFPVSGEVTEQGTTVLVPNATPGAGATMNFPATCVIDPATSICGATANATGGTFTRDAGTGDVTFVGNNGFVGSTNVTYRVVDNFGQTAESVMAITVKAPPVVNNITNATAVGVPVELTPSGTPASGLTFDTTETCVRETVSSSCEQSILLAGVGTFEYQVGTEKILFTPVNPFEGTASAFYRMTDSLGGQTTATITVTVANTTTATDISGTTGANTVVELDPIVTPTPGQSIASICVSATSDTATCGTSATITGGVLTYDSGTNKIVFTPTVNYSGIATGYYRATDTNDASSTASVTITVVPGPTTESISTTVGRGAVATLTPDATAPPGYTINQAETCLLASVGAASCTTSVAVPDRGTFTYSAATGTITFQPVNNLVTGTATIYYRVTDNLGTNSVVTADTSAVTVNLVAVPTAPALTGTTTLNLPVSIPITASAATGATLDNTKTCLRVSPTGTCQSTATVTGQGTFTYTEATNTVTFQPVTNYVSGSVPSTVWYTVTDNFNSSATNTIAVTVTGTAPTPSPTSPTPTPTATVPGGGALPPGVQTISGVPTVSAGQRVVFPLCTTLTPIAAPTAPATPVPTSTAVPVPTSTATPTPAGTATPTATATAPMLLGVTGQMVIGAIAPTSPIASPTTIATPTSPDPLATSPGGVTATSPAGGAGETVTGPCVGHADTDLQSVQISEVSSSPSWSSVSIISQAGTWDPRPGAPNAVSFTATNVSSTPGANPAPTSAFQFRNTDSGTTSILVRMRKAGDPNAQFEQYAVTVPYTLTSPVTPINATTDPTALPDPINDGGIGGIDGSGGAFPDGFNPGGTGPVVPTGVLPDTGGNILLPGIIGLALMGLGGAFLSVWYRRNVKTLPSV
jgi:hypothetical protein